MRRYGNSRGGFSLFELMVVLAILAILTGAVVPMFRDSLRGIRGGRAVKDLVGVMKFAQERAMMESTEYRFHCSKESGRYWVTRFEKVDEDGERIFEPVLDGYGMRALLPEHMSFGAISARRDREDRSYFVAFYPNGACDVASLTLVREGEKPIRIRTRGRPGPFDMIGAGV